MAPQYEQQRSSWERRPAVMQKQASSKSSSSGSVHSFLSASSASSSPEAKHGGHRKGSSHGSGDGGYGGYGAAGGPFRPGQRPWTHPDHSPFTPHPALQLGTSMSSSMESCAAAYGRASPVMPHYKPIQEERAGVGLAPAGSSQPSGSRQGTTQGGEGPRSSRSRRGFGAKANSGSGAGSGSVEKEAHLLDYYFDHYWTRSMP